MGRDPIVSATNFCGSELLGARPEERGERSMDIRTKGLGSKEEYQQVTRVESQTSHEEAKEVIKRDWCNENTWETNNVLRRYNQLSDNYTNEEAIQLRKDKLAANTKKKGDRDNKKEDYSA